MLLHLATEHWIELMDNLITHDHQHILIIVQICEYMVIYYIYTYIHIRTVRSSANAGSVWWCNYIYQLRLLCNIRVITIHTYVQIYTHVYTYTFFFLFKILLFNPQKSLLNFWLHLWISINSHRATTTAIKTHTYFIATNVG